MCKHRQPSYLKRFFLSFISLLIFSVIPLTSNAQRYKEMMYDNSFNFYDVVNEAERYFKEKEKGKGSGWKGFQRWVEENESKYYPSGDRSNIDPYFTKNQYEEFLINNPTLKTLYTTGWEELGPIAPGQIAGHYSFGMGRIKSFYVDPLNTQTLYIGTQAGGFWKSLDGGSTWTGGSTDFLAACGVGTIAVSPTNSNSILINISNSSNYTSHGIYRSVDGGDNWTLSNFNPTTMGYGGLGSDFTIHKIKYHPTIPNLIIIGTEEGIFRSDDNLATWTHVATNTNMTDIDFHPTNPNIIYAYADNQPNVIYVSTNAGMSFTTTSISGNSNNKGTVAVSPDCPNCVYYCSGNGIWKSYNSGGSFTQISSVNVSDAGFAVSDLNDNNMLAGYVDAMFSTNGGTSFNQVTYWSLGNTNGAGNGNQNSYNTSTNYIHADLQAAECINGIFYAVTDGFLVSSSDNGIHWNILSEDIGIRMNYCLGVSQSNHDRTIVGSQDNGISANTENGWVEIYGADGMEGIIHPLNDDWMIGSVQGGIRRRSFNGGQSTGNATPPGQSGSWIAPMVYDPNEQMRIYSFGKNIHRSDDFGNSWTNVGSPSFTQTVERATIAENNSNILVVTRYQNIEKSTNGGVSWTNIKGNLPNYTITDVAFDPNDDNTIVVTYNRYQHDNAKVFITHNQGATWQNITANLGNMPVQSVVIDHTDAATIYLGTEIGVYKKAMASSTWLLHNPDLPNTSIKEMEIMRGTNTLRATTWGRGLWEYTIDGRLDYPAILTTEISNPPTFETPMQGVNQYVTTTIDYDNTLTSVWTEWSINNPTFGNVIPMSNTSGNVWKSDIPLPNQPVGTKLFFKVFAVGNSGDTTETYKFQYTVQPFEICDASGDSNGGNLYLSSVTVDNMVNNSLNDAYTYYVNSLINLKVDSTYSITLNANNNWPNNDFGAWIDFNKDAVFSSNESILYDLNAGGSASGSFTVPSNAIIGDTLHLRTRLGYWGNPALGPCGTTLGEVEDYPVIIYQNLTGTNNSTICTTGSVIINGTTYDGNNPTGTEIFTNVGPNNLDSVVTINLTVLPELSGTHNPTICYSESVIINGTVYDAANPSGTETFNNIGANNCDSTVSVNLTVLPELSGTYNPTICYSESVIINGTVYDAANPSGTETFNNIGANNCDSTVSVNLTVESSINVTITNSSPTLTANQSGASYQWLDCDNGNAPIALATSQNYTATTIGNYAVEITIGSCTETSACENVTIIDIDENESNFTSIYPNPSTGIVNIDFEKNNSLINYNISTAKGKLIKTGETNLNRITIDLSKESKGIYFIKVNTSQTAKVYKLIMQ